MFEDKVPRMFSPISSPVCILPSPLDEEPVCSLASQPATTQKYTIFLIKGQRNQFSVCQLKVGRQSGEKIPTFFLRFSSPLSTTFRQVLCKRVRPEVGNIEH